MNNKDNIVVENTATEDYSHTVQQRSNSMTAPAGPTVSFLHRATGAATFMTFISKSTTVLPRTSRLPSRSKTASELMIRLSTRLCVKRWQTALSMPIIMAGRGLLSSKSVTLLHSQIPAISVSTLKQQKAAVSPTRETPR